MKTKHLSIRLETFDVYTLKHIQEKTDMKPSAAVRAMIRMFWPQYVAIAKPMMKEKSRVIRISKRAT